jgi:hypothetical protein
MLPPLVAGQGVGPMGGGSNYQQYGYRPSKLRSLNNKPYMGGGQHGLSGEKIKLNHHGSNEKLPTYQYMSPTGEREQLYQNNASYDNPSQIGL